MLSAGNISSTEKSNKPTMRNTVSPISFPEESSTLSLNFEQLKTLMKKKEKQYQNQLQIQDAERVHNFLVDLQQKQKQSGAITSRNSRIRRKKEIQKYNKETIEEFNREWHQIFQNTYKQFEQIENTLEQQHEKQVKEAQAHIEQIKNGKNLQKIRFSKQILQMQDQLRKLAKTQLYQQAYILNQKFQKARVLQMKKYLSQTLNQKQIQLHKLKKQHQKQKQNVSSRLNQMYERQKARYRNESSQLTKNLKTYEIDLTKVQALLNRRDRDRNKTAKTRKRSCNTRGAGLNSALPPLEIITIINNQSVTEEGKVQKQECL